MIKKIFFVALTTLLTYSVQSQNFTSSPYSYFGLGDVLEFNNGQTASMGGAGIALNNSYYLNLKNPASYSSFDTLSFRFEIGFQSKMTEFSTNEVIQYRDDHNISYIAIGFPIIDRWRATISLTPLTAVGYKISDNYFVEDIGDVETYYYGEGGLSNLMIGNSFKILDNLSIGLNSSYYFGKKTYLKSLFIPDDVTSINSIYDNTLLVKGFSFEAGINYNYKISEKYNLLFGATYSKNSELNATSIIIGGSTNLPYDDFFVPENMLDTIRNEETEGKLTYPSKLGFGLAFTDNQHLTIAFDYVMQQWSQYELLGKKDNLNDFSKVALGIEYIPSPNHFKFHKRLKYRLGGNYINTQYTLDNNNIKQYGINFGIGIPARRSKTSFNLGFELGKRGTKNNNLINENYALFSLNLSFSDIWFYKRKYD